MNYTVPLNRNNLDRMRSRFIIIILIVGLNQACVEKPKQIISDTIDIRQEFGFAKVKAPTKSKLKKSYFSECYFCYSGLDLFEDSTFYQSNCCEGRLRFSIGKWRINRDSLILKYTPLNNLNLIIDYSYKGDTSKFFVLKVKNQENEPIENFVLKGFKIGDTAKHALKYGSIKTNKKGEIKVRKEDFDSLMVYSFINITQKVLILKRAYLPDSLKLTLYYNNTNFCNNPTYEFIENSSTFRIKRTKLIGIYGELRDEK